MQRPSTVGELRLRDTGDAFTGDAFRWPVIVQIPKIHGIPPRELRISVFLLAVIRLEIRMQSTARYWV